MKAFYSTESSGLGQPYVTRNAMRFNQWAIKAGITDDSLRQALSEIETGLIDANLGGNVYKQRVRFQGRGKRSGARILIVLKAGDKVFFVYGFAKNQQDNISDRELKALKRLAKELLQYTDSQLRNALIAGELIEVLSYE